MARVLIVAMAEHWLPVAARLGFPLVICYGIVYCRGLRSAPEAWLRLRRSPARERLAAAADGPLSLHGAVAVTLTVVLRPLLCWPVVMLVKPCARQRSANALACSVVQPWLARPVTP